jgi:protoporphyrinogen/coproporphyrinogen III oxidase
MKKTIIIGGGISGLTAGLALQKQGQEVLVLEAGSTVGGNIQTVAKDGFHIERGPHSFMASADNVWRLVDQLGLEPRIEVAAGVSKNRYIFRNGRLHALPTSPMAFLMTRLLSLRAKLRLGLEPFMPGRAQLMDTAWDFFLRRFGREAATYIMGPFISGIYAGDIHTLGARAAFPKFWHFEKERGSMILGAMGYMRDKKKRRRALELPQRKGLYTIAGGLGNLTKEAGLALGDSVHTNTPVQGVLPKGSGFLVRTDHDEMFADAVIIATPPGNTAQILGTSLPLAAEELRSIPMAPVAMVHWSKPASSPWIPKGFGVLIPRLYKLGLLGVLFPSQLFTGRAPEGRELFASFLGGVQNPDLLNLDDDSLIDIVQSDHRTIFNADPGKPEMVDILRKRDGIPQLLPDHPERIARIMKQVGTQPGLCLAGNYLTGVGVENAVESGYLGAQQTLDFFREDKDKAQAPAGSRGEDG